MPIQVQALEPLVQHTAHAAKVGKMGSRGLTNVAYGAALSGMEASFGLLFAALASAAKHSVGEFNAQDLANTAWAFATADQ